ASLAAASCLAESISERAQRADLIAYGRLNGDRFEIRQVLKGSASGTIQVRLQAEKGVVTSVDYMPADGTDQTLYLRLENGEYVTDACSGSHTGMPDAEERAFFGLSDEAAFWTMGGGVDEVGGSGSGSGTDSGTGSASVQTTGLLLAVSALGIGALGLVAVRRLARNTA
ncbi:MAG TPA: hypothetical protein VMT85_22680, partial [Thermoanaerobaculia bacterium]|nr:hypothetical protein [Thermoanaerobaculia bacterium]